MKPWSFFPKNMNPDKIELPKSKGKYSKVSLQKEKVQVAILLGALALNEMHRNTYEDNSGDGRVNYLIDFGYFLNLWSEILSVDNDSFEARCSIAIDEDNIGLGLEIELHYKGKEPLVNHDLGEIFHPGDLVRCLHYDYENMKAALALSLLIFSSDHEELDFLEKKILPIDIKEINEYWLELVTHPDLIKEAKDEMFDEMMSFLVTNYIKDIYVNDHDCEVEVLNTDYDQPTTTTSQSARETSKPSTKSNKNLN